VAAARVCLDLLGSPRDTHVVVEARLAIHQRGACESLDLASSSRQVREPEDERLGVQRLHRVVPRACPQRGDVL
jgi:hypothetical protein